MMEDIEEEEEEAKLYRNESIANENVSKGWLNLSLGGNLELSNVIDDSDQTKPNNSSTKMFSCNFCMRKFYSSQALGGHQNAHKRERGEAKRYQFQRIMAMMGLPPLMNNNAANFMDRSLCFRPHSLLLQRPNREPYSHGGSAANVARFDSAGTTAVCSSEDDELMDITWPESFRFNTQQQTEVPMKLDLNLKP